MSWLWRGFQSAVFHYVSCAPCAAYFHRKKRKTDAKKHERDRRKLYKDQPELADLEHYRQPGPTGTNPYWHEEIAMGPGPAPRRTGKRTNTGSASHKSSTPVCQHSALGSAAGSSSNNLRVSDEDDENWNRRRYQREDEELWGMEEWNSPLGSDTTARDSSVRLGITRPGTSKSSAESCSCNAQTRKTGTQLRRTASPAIIVSTPSVRPADNHWMLQPPPKARIMAGKERATRSRSGSGASSRVELSLHRQVSSRHLLLRRESGGTPETRESLRGTVSQRHDRPKTPLTRPHSGSSSPEKRRRRDTAMTMSDETNVSSADSGDTVVHARAVISRPIAQRATPPVSFADITARSTPPSVSRAPSPVASLKMTRVRSSLQRLSTVVSSGSEGLMHADQPPPFGENQRSRKQRRTLSSGQSGQSSDSNPYLMMKRRTPLGPSDISSLNTLQDLVPPSRLTNSRFASSPLPEARISLPPADPHEEVVLNCNWTGSGFGVSRGWGSDVVDGQPMHLEVPVEESTETLIAPQPRDPRSRWSNIF